MDINEMTREQFEKLEFFDENACNCDVDSIVLLPTKKHHDSGYNIFYVIACNRDKPIGKCFGYDTFSITMGNAWNRVGVDCLRGSGLMRIFLPTNEYVIDPVLHQIEKK